MKNHVQLNPIIAYFKRVDIISLIYKALYLTNPLPPPPPAPPKKNTISAIFSVLFAFYRRIVKVSCNSCAFFIITDD